MCQFVSGFSSTDQYAMLPQQIVLLRYDRMTKRQHGLYCCVGKNIEQERNVPGLLSNINTCLTSRIQFVSLSKAPVSRTWTVEEPPRSVSDRYSMVTSKRWVKSLWISQSVTCSGCIFIDNDPSRDSGYHCRARRPSQSYPVQYQGKE